MVLSRRRGAFQGISRKVGLAFSELPLSSAHWTILSVVLAFGSFYFLFYSMFLYAAVLFILSAFLDFADGAVAGVSGKYSARSNYMDTIVDRYVEAIVVFGLLFVALPGFFLSSNFWILLYLFGALMTPYAKAAAKEKELVRKELTGGIMESGERIIILFIGLVLAYFSRYYLTYILVVLAILSNLTVLQRAYTALRSGEFL